MLCSVALILSPVFINGQQNLADGEDPVRYLGPTLRLNVYQQDPYR